MIYLDHLLAATGGQLSYAGTRTHFEGFSHDTRQLLPGEMFVAVRGEHGDGHDFVRDAVGCGAGGVLVEAWYMQRIGAPLLAELESSGITAVVVEDTRLALQYYAREILRRWHPIVVAVTGSTGKTSAKEAIAAVLASNYATFKSWQNYNDLLGLPLSLGRLEERHEYAVLEMGCDHPGEIEQLCALTRPTIGVLTNISPYQLQYFGSMQRLAAEFATMLNCLPEHGTAFVGDLSGYPLPTEIKAPLHPFSVAEVQAAEISWEGIHVRLAEEQQEIEMRARLLGRHTAGTLLAAYQVGRHCGVTTEAIGHALERFEPVRGRLRALPGVESATLLDDTHNACPASTSAGLATLHELPASLRIAVLGDMLRLGEYEAEGHRQVGTLAASCVDYLVTRGERAALIAEAAHKAGLPPERIIATATHEDTARVVQHLLQQQKVQPEEHSRSVVLIKGSEQTRMERVTELLLAQPEQAPEELVRQTPGWKQIVLMRPERPTWLEIDLSAIANNTRLMQELVGPDVRVLVSLKADGYGHGAIKVARTALHNGASMLGVATVSEAAPLRQAGISAPILVFGYVPLWQMREAVRLDLTVTLYTLNAARALTRTAQALEKSVRVHVKVDTGMGRLGVRFEQMDEILELVREVKRLPHLEFEGLFTHFAKADTDDQEHARLQLTRFQELLRVLEAEGLRPPLVHAANSAATLSLPAARFNMVRPGIALYGLDPSPEVRVPEGFRPALAFKTQVAQVKLIPTGECISYGCTYITERPTTIAVLPVGYADGFRRAPANWGSVLIHGQEAPLVGRVCMDQCMVDVTALPDVRVGDEVVLIGRQGEALLSAETIAQRLGTINYEVVSEILARVPRVD